MAIGLKRGRTASTCVEKLPSNEYRPGNVFYIAWPQSSIRSATDFAVHVQQKGDKRQGARVGQDHAPASPDAGSWRYW
jgi:hypothetical protein